MASVTIHPQEAYERYGVCSEDGFTIHSNKSLTKSDQVAIREILGAFVRVELADSVRRHQLSKLRQYRDSETHAEFFQMATDERSKALTDYADIKKKYSITKIESFRGRY